MEKQLTFIFKVVIICLFYFNLSSAYAQNCGCTLQITQEYLDLKKNIIDGSTLQPGSKICLMGGTVNGNIIFRNIVGSATSPILIINCGGKFILNAGTAFAGIKFERSKYFRITGTGVSSIKYGIEVTGSNRSITLEALSTNFEVDHLDLHGAHFAGIMAKSDPAACNPEAWRGNFTMYDISIHDNYVHSTYEGEGMYIGHSFYGGQEKICAATEDTLVVYPHDIRGAKIFNNITYDTGADGIQVGAAIEGCEIYNNRIEKYGQRPFDNRTDQGNGIQLGDGTGGLCYNNFIRNEPPAGAVDRTCYSIACFGTGDNVIFNNIMIGASTGGMFVDERSATKTGAGSGFKIINNTIVNPKKNGLLIYSDLVEMNYVKNNIIVNPELKYISCLSKNVKMDSTNNYETRAINTVNFADASRHNYHLESGSPAINKGMNASVYGVTFDFDRISRPQQGVYDIGAFEFKSGGWLQIRSNNVAGKAIAMYYDSQKSNAVQKAVREGGNDKLEFYLKHISGTLAWSRLQVELTVSYQTKTLLLKNFLTDTILSQWKKISIPLSAFNHDPERWIAPKGVSTVVFKSTAGFGAGDFGLDEIKFTGGTTPFVWYGDAYQTSGLATSVNQDLTAFYISQRPTTGGAASYTSSLRQEGPAQANLTKLTNRNELLLTNGDQVSIYSHQGVKINQFLYNKNSSEQEGIVWLRNKIPAGGFFIIQIRKSSGEVITRRISFIN